MLSPFQHLVRPHPQCAAYFLIQSLRLNLFYLRNSALSLQPLTSPALPPRPSLPGQLFSGLPFAVVCIYKINTRVNSPTPPSRSFPTLRFSRPSWGRRAFNLIEVTIALGIVAFAFVGLFALLPNGMQTFRRSMELSVCTQIAQRVINDAQQTDFSTLIDEKNLPPYSDAIAALTFRAPLVSAPGYRYFDDQGDEIRSSRAGRTDLSDLTAEQQRRISYWVNTRVMPWGVLPGRTVQRAQHMASVTVQVAFNPSNAPLPIDRSDPNDANRPLRNLFASKAGVSVITYSALIGRNL